MAVRREKSGVGNRQVTEQEDRFCRIGIGSVVRQDERLDRLARIRRSNVVASHDPSIANQVLLKLV